MFLIDVEPLLQVFFHNLVGKGVNLADLNILPFLYAMWIEHSWESASWPMPPASVFRHPSSQSGGGAFRFLTGPPYSDTAHGSTIGISLHSGTGPTGCRAVRHSGVL